MKPNCYKCIHRRSIPGDAHSACNHPEAMKGLKDNPMAEILAIFGRGPEIARVRALGVTCDPHAVRMGWFNWPINFDPTWLETCEGFTRKDQESPKK